MNKLSVLLLAMISFGSISCKSQTSNNLIKMKNDIKKVIKKFVKAGEERNVEVYKDILHEEFRVIANRYPTPEKTSILPASVYIDLISKKVIGGTKYQVIFNSINITEHSATALTELKTEKGGQFVTFLLVLNPKNDWKIIADMATQKNS